MSSLACSCLSQNLVKFLYSPGWLAELHLVKGTISVLGPAVTRDGAAGGGGAGAVRGAVALAFGGGGLKGAGLVGVAGTLAVLMSASSFAIASIADGSLERLRTRSCRGPGVGGCSVVATLVPGLVCQCQT